MKRKFNFAKGIDFEVKEVIEKAGIPFSWDWEVCTCPHCNKKVMQTRQYTIDKVEVLEAPNGDKIYMGVTKEIFGGRPLTMRLPDSTFHTEKNMTSLIESKRQGVKDGN
jgi:hypothetical protein